MWGGSAVSLQYGSQMSRRLIYTWTINTRAFSAGFAASQGCQRGPRTGKPFVLCNSADAEHDSKNLQTVAACKVSADPADKMLENASFRHIR